MAQDLQLQWIQWYGECVCLWVCWTGKASWIWYLKWVLSSEGESKNCKILPENDAAEVKALGSEAAGVCLSTGNFGLKRRSSKWVYYGWQDPNHGGVAVYVIWGAQNLEGCGEVLISLKHGSSMLICTLYIHNSGMRMENRFSTSVSSYLAD